MSLYGVMRTSTSGMAAQANRLSTVADNIANSNTTGYKRASAEFSSLLLPSGSGQYNSGSVNTHVRNAISEQGGLQATTSITDLAISGNGFFVVTDQSGTSYLSRAGSFVPDSAGNLVNAGGYYLMGLPITNGQTPDVVANGYSGLEVVNLSQLAMRAEASTAGKLRVNLPSNADAVALADRPSQGGAVFTAKTSLIAYDNLGNEVLLDVYSTKTADNTWEVSVFNKADAAAGGGFPYASGPLATETLAFDPATGNLTSASASSVDIPIPNGQTLTLDFTGSSQLAADYTVFESPVNGTAPVGVDSVDITRDGTIYAVYENGARVPVYRIPLANVPSPDNLNSVAGNVYSVSATSGDVQLGVAGAGGFGDVVSGSLEQSTVDMATELTTMIDAQRGFAANSKVFQSGAELMDVIVNLKR
ncbi:MAG: flagellar hook protein FlgE [Parvibaculaceae bacterium]